MSGSGRSASTAQPYLALIRGINVGGRNKVPMAELRASLQELGFTEVSTYIASGNVLLRSDLPAAQVSSLIEDHLPSHFTLDDPAVRVLVLGPAQLRTVIENKPNGFGEQPDTYHSDAIFLIGIDADAALPVFQPREGVDRVWPGAGVIYSQRVSAERTRSRLGKIIGTPAYRSMTIRSWSTTTRLWDMLGRMSP
jgi:uncharacterized protein (DUF1697 family)